MKGRISALLVVLLEDLSEVELPADDVPNQVNRIVLRHELQHRLRQQPDLLDRPRTERLVHRLNRSHRPGACRSLTETAS